MIDAIAAADPDLAILDWLIQAGISTPRSKLAPGEILRAAARFDRFMPVWPKRLEIQTKHSCPTCGQAKVHSRGVARGREYWGCWKCGWKGVIECQTA